MQSLNKHQAGIALLLVLMITAVLSTVVILQQYRTMQLVQLSEMTANSIAARNAGISTRNQLLFQILTTDIWAYGPAAGPSQTADESNDINFWGEPFHRDDSEVTVVDAGSLLSLIPFDADSWRAVLLSFGLEDPLPITDSIEDWIDQDDFVRLHGAESQDYATPGLPRNDSPQSIDELLLVKNMTPSIFQSLRPYISYYGGGTPATAFMPAPLLPAFIGEMAVEQTVQQRSGQSDEFDDILAPQSERGDVYPSSRLLVSIKTTKQNAVYQESFLLVRGVGTARFAYITELRPNVIWKQEH